jgi:hypothetical protein
MNDPGGLMSSSAAANPNFHDWNAVYVPYCDGTSWSGDLDGPVEGLYFRGKVRGERRPTKPANAIAPCRMQRTPDRWRDWLLAILLPDC